MNSKAKKLVLTVLSLGKGNEFERSPAIQGPTSNSRNLSEFSPFDHKALSILLFTNYIDAHLLNRHTFGNGRKKNV